MNAPAITEFLLDSINCPQPYPITEFALNQIGANETGLRLWNEIVAATAGLAKIGESKNTHAAIRLRERRTMASSILAKSFGMSAFAYEHDAASILTASA
jgi:hypothetical protein